MQTVRTKAEPPGSTERPTAAVGHLRLWVRARVPLAALVVIGSSVILLTRFERTAAPGANPAGKGLTDTVFVGVLIGALIIGVSALVTNAGRRRRDGQAAVTDLAESTERFRSVFDNAPVGVVITSLDPSELGRLLEVNGEFCAMTGFTQDELLAMSTAELTVQEDRSRTDDALRALADGTRRSLQLDKHLIRADGEIISVRLTASAVHPKDRPAYAVSFEEDITARMASEAQLAHWALHDPLTNLANRHLLMDHLGLVLRELGRRPGCVALLFADVDDFKTINDRFGHDAGDRVLIEIGRRLRTLLRAEDTAARFGGDEFILVCPYVDGRAAAVRIAERAQEAIGEPIEIDGMTLRPAVSIGIAVTDWSGIEPEELLHKADVAMYHAKHRGRNRYELYREGFEHLALSRLGVEAEIRTALAEGWFRLYYQPIIDLDTGAIVATEALLRMAHPERGLLSPREFIGVAEDSDLIVEIGNWALAEACRQLSLWAPYLPLEMAVNVSARQTANGALSRQVLGAAARAGVDPANLCLEMTEGVLIEAGDSVIADLRDLTSQGVKIALDDFGTGYSSLTYLQLFPVAALKIDRSFIDGLDRKPRGRAIVAAVSALGVTLDLTVVAEGVETAEELGELRRLHCPRAQGFYFAHPQEADAVTDLLRTRLAEQQMVARRG